MDLIGLLWALGTLSVWSILSGLVILAFRIPDVWRWWRER